MQMQRSNALIRVVFILILAAILTYFGFYVYRTFVNPMRTVQAVSATVTDAAAADGYMVRDEEALSASGVISPVADGKKVAANGLVAICYTSENALEQADRILELQERIASLQKTLDGTDAETPETVISSLSEAVTVRRMEDLDTLVNQARYVLFGSSSSVEQAQEELEQAQEELEKLQASQSGYRVVLAERPGLFCGTVDGYETVGPDDLENLTPGRLLLLFDGERSRNGFGRLIHGTVWYYACVLPSDRADDLEEGRTMTLSFTDGYTGSAEMKVVSVSSADPDGNCAAVFSCDTGLAGISAVRKASADIVFSQKAGILLPDEALCGGAADPHVFILAGLQARKVPVELLSDSQDGYTLLQAAEGYSLNPGVTVITTTDGLYDGKVVR